MSPARAYTRTTSESPKGPENGVTIVSWRLELNYNQKAHYPSKCGNGHSASAVSIVSYRIGQFMNVFNDRCE